MSTNSYDFALLTVLRPELDSLLHVLGECVVDTKYHPTLGQIFVVSMSLVLQSEGALRGVIVPIEGIGRIDSALATATVLRTWQPRFIVLVGVAGGVEANGVDIGDIVVSTEIVDYAIHKVTPSGVDLRPRRYTISQDLISLAKGLVKDSQYSYSFNGQQASGRVHFGPIASGDQVVASSSVVKRLIENEPRLLGIEMEGAGVAAAIKHEEQPTTYITIRGIADLADEAKGDLWIGKACAAAASFAKDFLVAIASLG
jgi:nucleoside phosphorylase